MLKGYAGKRVHVNLSTGKISEKELDESFCKTYLGGKGFGASILYRETRRGLDPLSPESLLIFAVGPLNATLAPGANRFAAFFKSPLTGIWGESYCGGYIGTQFKRAGLDLLTITGRSRKPVYLQVDDGKVEIKSADHLWGKDTFETEDILTSDLGKEFQVAAIGPAGENLVRFACVDHAKGRQLGRCGIGAVMGSKKLKALAVRGSKNPEVANPEALNEIRRKILEDSKTKLQSLANYGTPAIAALTNSAGVFPTRNWTAGYYEKYEDISAETLKSKLYKRRRACYGCPIACCQISEVAEGPYAGTVVEGPEYETLFALGSLCDNNMPEAIAKANELCDRLGMDTISAGNVVAFAMECYQRKILTSEDTGGIQLKFGNHEAIMAILPQIAYRKGLGMVLAEGVRRAAEIIGKGSERFAIHVKGLEPPGYDPRGLKGMALAYAVNCRGACHLRHMAYRPNLVGKHAFNPEKPIDRLSYEDQPSMIKELEDYYAAVDSMIYCHFFCLPVIGPILWEEFTQIYNAVTGADASREALLEAAVRINDTIRLYNLRENVPKDTVFPERWLREKLKTGGSAGQIVHRAMLRRMLARYYQERGWSRTGRPKTGKPKAS